MIAWHKKKQCGLEKKSKKHDRNPEQRKNKSHRAKTYGDREQDKEIFKTNKKEYSSGKRETKKDNSKPK